MLRAFYSCKSGNLATIFALSAVPLLVALAGAVDYTMTSLKASEVQSALDASALAIATKYYSGMSYTELAAFGEDHFRANANLTGAAAKFTYVKPGSTSDAALATNPATDKVIVKASFTHQGMLRDMQIWKATRISVVELSQGKPACFLSLDKHASESVKLQGTTDIHLNGCVLASNSDAADSVSRGGSAKLKAECVSTVGGTEGLSPGGLTDLKCLSPRVHQYPARDPLANVTPPVYTACKNVPGGKTKTLSPGTYCNETFSGEITLQPGTYILRGGQIKLGGNGTLTGLGVTIFLMENASITLNANQVIKLSPPETGPYAGITIYQAKGNTNALLLNGGSGSTITGFIYAPDAHINFTGNSAMAGAGECVRVVGDTIEMTGTSNVSTDCEKALGGRTMYAGGYIAIVR